MLFAFNQAAAAIREQTNTKQISFFHSKHEEEYRTAWVHGSTRWNMSSQPTVSPLYKERCVCARRWLILLSDRVEQTGVFKYRLLTQSLHQLNAIRGPRRSNPQFGHSLPRSSVACFVRAAHNCRDARFFSHASPEDCPPLSCGEDCSSRDNFEVIFDAQCDQSQFYMHLTVLLLLLLLFLFLFLFSSQSQNCHHYFHLQTVAQITTNIASDFFASRVLGHEHEPFRELVS